MCIISCPVVSRPDFGPDYGGGCVMWSGVNAEKQSLAGITTCDSNIDPQFSASYTKTTGATMPEQADDGSLTSHNAVPFPIAPRKKAAFLITIIFLSILQIAFGALSLPIIYRHSGYGRRGAWTRPWNEDGIPGMAVFGVRSPPS